MAEHSRRHSQRNLQPPPRPSLSRHSSSSSTQTLRPNASTIFQQPNLSQSSFATRSSIRGPPLPPSPSALLRSPSGLLHAQNPNIRRTFIEGQSFPPESLQYPTLSISSTLPGADRIEHFRYPVPSNSPPPPEPHMYGHHGVHEWVQGDFAPPGEDAVDEEGDVYYDARSRPRTKGTASSRVFSSSCSPSLSTRKTRAGSSSLSHSRAPSYSQSPFHTDSEDSLSSSDGEFSSGAEDDDGDERFSLPSTFRSRRSSLARPHSHAHMDDDADTLSSFSGERSTASGLTRSSQAESLRTPSEWSARSGSRKRRGERR
ncbi:hypothetical protein JCM6882_002186 [Rhodosporidiobolus microsporus]